MNKNNTEDSGGSKFNLGIILILFILLVIVTCTFSIGSNRPAYIEFDDESSSITDTRVFNIINNTSSLTLNVVSIVGPSSWPTPSIIVPNGGVTSFYVSSNGFNTTRAEVRLNVNSANRVSVGGLQCTLVNLNSQDKAYFSNVSITTPIRAAPQQSQYPENIAKLTIYDVF
ncbi:hypothetical protein [Paenibacillus herberti]|uniref:Uncharacterized protein n=1 Tax=Paenibacillus herberti TaxID=1619309 RepID=A0A229P3X4_9BACL|nr:hypothetical protein [Paenibacillus herberti]OXM16777.1 hypothetical protein CGZ75_09015 [Paenibacillus herberti]